jgi:hypothetical protein
MIEYEGLRTKISHKNVIQDTEHRFEKNVTYDKLGKFPGTLMSISIAEIYGKQSSLVILLLSVSMAILCWAC